MQIQEYMEYFFVALCIVSTFVVGAIIATIILSASQKESVEHKGLMATTYICGTTYNSHISRTFYTREFIQCLKDNGYDIVSTYD